MGDYNLSANFPSKYPDDNAANSLPFSDCPEGLKTEMQAVADQYRMLCEKHTLGVATDIELFSFLQYSDREVKLLNSLSSEQKLAYHLACEKLVAHSKDNQKRILAEKSQALCEFNREETVAGDGNCGLHSIARGVIEKMNETMKKRLVDCITTWIEDDKDPDREKFLSQLFQLPSDKKAVLKDTKFMQLFATVLRKIGHKGIAKLYDRKIKEMGDSEEVRSIMNHLIPEQNGEWVDHEGLFFLARALGLKIAVKREETDKAPVIVFSSDDDLAKELDFVITYKGGHFTPVFKS